jgi:glycine hydroxymethyltransferase
LEKNILREQDPEVYNAIRAETDRQKNNLLMIASENYVSRAVIEAHANLMTNKYAEGYPGARYYGGCKYVDVVENLALERSKKIFSAQYANVQPHSGSQANMAVYLAFLDPGDLIMGMDLTHGGHLTHGSPVSFSGKLYRTITYGLDPKTGRIDFDRMRNLAKEHKPKLIVAGASAYPRIIEFDRFKEIAHENGAYLMADMAHIAGLVATNQHPSPVGVADFVTTTTHKTLRGPRGGLILSQKEHSGTLDKAVFPGVQGGPLMHIIAAKAVAFKEALKPEFSNYQKQTILNAKTLAEEFKKQGFDLVSDGTDNHLILMDLTEKNITGIDAEIALGKAGIVVNKNSVPFDKRSPKVTSGLRFGAPGLTTRGLKEQEVTIVARLITGVLNNLNSDETITRVRKTVSEICGSFPIYQDFITS